MLSQIEKNCQNFYRMKLGIENAFDLAKFDVDFFKINKEKDEKKYVLLDSPEKLFKSQTCDLKEMFFFFRNNNQMMLTLIENLPKSAFLNLSSFFAHFFYENIFNPTFTQEELLLLIYLLLEQVIDKISNTTSPYSFLNEKFVLFLLKSLNRKDDIRQYLILILSELVINLENFTEGVLSVQIYKIKNQLKEQQKPKDEGFNLRGSVLLPTSSKLKGDDGFQKLNDKELISSGKFGLKRTQTSNNFKDKEDIITPHYFSPKERTFEESFDDMENEKQQQRNSNDNIDEDLFTKTEISLSTLEHLLSEVEKSNSQSVELKQYLQKQINHIKPQESKLSLSSQTNTSDINDTNNDTQSSISSEQKQQILNFSNDTVRANLKNYEPEVTEIFINNANQILNVLDMFLQKLIDNINIIPYTIKCIGKIVDTLVLQKFQNDNTVSELDKAMYTITILFESFIIPIIGSPDFNGLITTNSISKSTKNNLQVLVKILKQFLKGTLFTSSSKDCEFTVFNSYIIRLMTQSLRLVEIIRETKLPRAIDHINSNRNNSDIKMRDINYPYFTYNEKENITHQSICLNLQDVKDFISVIKEHKPKFSETIDLIAQMKINEDPVKILNMKATLDNVVQNETNIDTLIKEESVNKEQLNVDDKTKGKSSANDEKQLKTEKVEIHFASFSQVIYKKEFKDMLDGNISSNTNANNKKNDIQLIKINKIKQSLLKVLTYINKISKSSFNDAYTANNSFENYIIPKIKLMLNQHQANDVTNHFKGTTCPPTNSFNKTTSHIEQPYPFYFTYFVQNIKSLPESYRNNNYKLFLSELIKETEQKVKNARNDAINQIYLKVKGSEKLNLITNSSLLQLKQMEKTIASEKFVKDVAVRIKMELIPKDDFNNLSELKITAVSTIPKSKNEDGVIYCNKIQDFIKKFPDFSNLNQPDIIDFLESKKIDQSINNYFNIVKDSLKALPYFQKYSPEEFATTLSELENYIQCQINSKLFPAKRTKKDIKIHKKCLRLNWISPSNLIKDQKVVNENLWETAMNHINDMDKQISPANKIKSFGKAFAILQNSITFCTGKDELGVDDSIQVLLYVLLKAKPKKIWSNFNYSRLFIDPELSKKQFGLLLTQMEMVITIIENMKYTDLIGISEEQFGVDEKYEDINIDEDNEQ